MIYSKSIRLNFMETSCNAKQVLKYIKLYPKLR
jgi:hypothetical protein